MKGLFCPFSCLQPAQYLNSSTGLATGEIQGLCRHQVVMCYGPERPPVALKDLNNVEWWEYPGYSCQLRKVAVTVCLSLYEAG